MPNIPTWEEFKKFESLQLVLQILCFGLLILIVWNIYKTITFFPKLNKALKQQEIVVVTPTVKKDDNILPNYKLFGEYVPNNLNAAGVRPSSSNLTVVGVIFAEDEQDSQVMLRNASGHEDFFNFGAELPGGGIIKRITKEGVLILRNGELERLSLPKDELQFEDSIKENTIIDED